MAARQIRVMYAVLGVVAASALGAYLGGQQIESPAEVAARTAPPAPSAILVPVEQRVLSSDIVTRGTVRFGLPQPISIAPSSLKANPGLIATLPLRNAQLREGDVMLTASGRPVFLLQGRLPAFRDLGPGMFGDDVRQLEQALKRLGFDPGPVDEIYDQRTSAAAAEWYKSKGWEPFGPTRDQLASLRALERDWSDAMRAKLAAAAAVAAAAQSVESTRALAEQSIRAAVMEVAARADDRRKLVEAQSNNGVPLTLEAEHARADHADAAAVAEIALQNADAALISLDPRQPETARMAAKAKLDLARAARRKAKLEGELAILAAKQDLMLAGDRVKLAEAAEKAARLEGEKLVRAALDAQKLAEFDLKVATDRANQLAADLDAAKSRLGIQVPVDEIVFLPILPVRVEELKAVVGAAAAGVVMTVTDNQLAVDTALPLDAAPLVKPGMKVAIDEQAQGIKASGVVQFVANTPGTRGVDGYHIYSEIKVEETPVRLEGFSVRLTIPIKTTAGAVTAVPLSAVSLAADGTSRVMLQKNGTFDHIAVRPGLAAAGYVEVVPIDGKLAPGDLVVVGYKSPEIRNPELKDSK